MRSSTCHRTHAAREVRLHLVLVAGVGVHDVPARRSRSNGLGSAARLDVVLVVDGSTSTAPRRRGRGRSTIVSTSPRRSSAASVSSVPSPRRGRRGRVGHGRSRLVRSSMESSRRCQSWGGLSLSSAGSVRSQSLEHEVHDVHRGPVEHEDQRRHHDQTDQHDRATSSGSRCFGGQATFFISPRTSPKYCFGPVRSTCGFGAERRSGARGRSDP